MTRRGLWVARVAWTLIYLAAGAAWYWWLHSFAPGVSPWQATGLFVASGVVWLLLQEMRAVWRAKPNPNAKTRTQRRTQLAELRQQHREAGS